MISAPIPQRGKGAKGLPAPKGTAVTEVVGLLDLLKVDQCGRWQLGDSVQVEAYLEQHPQVRQDERAVLDLIANEIALRRQRGDMPLLMEYLARFGDFQTP